MTDLAVHPPTVPTPAPAPAVRLEGVDRTFGDINALDQLDLEIAYGQITVLLGPNGAGKTTAIRLITGALPADAGRCETFGVDPLEHGEDVRRRCGVVAAKPSLYDRLTGLENLRYAARLYEIDGDQDARMREAAARFGIDHALELEVGGYSTGMKTRLALARAILHDPELLLLDEPTSGLDPESSHAVLSLIRELTDDGRTVVMCTHLLAEAEGLADQVVMLEDGSSLVAGSQQDLIAMYWPRPAVLLDAIDGVPAATMEATGITATREGDFVRVEVDGADDIADLVTALVGAGVRLTRVDPENPSLEDLYFRIRRDRAAGVEFGASS